VVDAPTGHVTLGANMANGIEQKGIDTLQQCIKKCASAGLGIPVTVRISRLCNSVYRFEVRKTDNYKLLLSVSTVGLYDIKMYSLGRPNRCITGLACPCVSVSVCFVSRKQKAQRNTVGLNILRAKITDVSVFS